MKIKSAVLSAVFLLSIICESGVAQVYRIGGGGFGYGGGYGGGYGYSTGIRPYSIYGYGTGYQSTGGVRIVPVYYRVPVIIIRKKACECETAPSVELKIPTREEEKQAEKKEAMPVPDHPKPERLFERDEVRRPVERKPEMRRDGHRYSQKPRPDFRRDEPRKDDVRRPSDRRPDQRDVRTEPADRPSDQRRDQSEFRRRGRYRPGMREQDSRSPERRGQRPRDDRE